MGGYVGSFMWESTGRAGVSPLYNRIAQRHEDSFVLALGGRRYIRSHIRGDVLTLELEQKAAAVRDQLAAAVQQYGRVVYSNSLGAEDRKSTRLNSSHTD